jgi:hypothetical protein
MHELMVIASGGREQSVAANGDYFALKGSIGHVNRSSNPAAFPLKERIGLGADNCCDPKTAQDRILMRTGISG